MKRYFRWQPGSHQIEALALFALFLALYLLLFKGVFTAIDELALYALVRWHTGGHVRWAGLAALGVSLTIRRVGELSDFHHLFVHLLKTDFSHQVDGLDGPVKYGYSLVVPWELGHAYEEKRGIMLSPNTPPGTCAVIVGL